MGACSANTCDMMFGTCTLSIVFHSRADSLNVYAMCTRLSVFSEGYRTGGATYQSKLSYYSVVVLGNMNGNLRD